MMKYVHKSVEKSVEKSVVKYVDELYICEYLAIYGHMAIRP